MRWKQAITYDFHARGVRMLYYVLVACCPGLEPHFVVQTFEEFSEMEIRPNLGASCRRLVYNNTNARDDMTMRCFFFRMDAFV